MSGVDPDRSHPLFRARLTLAAERSPACLLDERMRVDGVNAAWDAFAVANGGAECCTGPAIVGSTYAKHVEGAGPRSLVERDLARALAGKVTSVDSECNTPDRLRRLRTHYLPVRSVEDGPVTGVLVVHSTVHEAPMEGARPATPPSEAAHRGGDGLIAMCSCCRRVLRPQAPGDWEYVPAYVARLPARVTHVVCTACTVLYGISPQEVQEILAR
jgi:hypothetical protein